LLDWVSNVPIDCSKVVGMQAHGAAFNITLCGSHHTLTCKGFTHNYLPMPDRPINYYPTNSFAHRKQIQARSYCYRRVEEERQRRSKFYLPLLRSLGMRPTIPKQEEIGDLMNCNTALLVVTFSLFKNSVGAASLEVLALRLFRDPWIWNSKVDSWGG
jgi:hypothetical protein